MKLNLKKIKIEYIIVICILVLGLLYVYRNCKEAYENDDESKIGPSPEITQEDLDLIMKMI